MVNGENCMHSFKKKTLTKEKEGRIRDFFSKSGTQQCDGVHQAIH